MTDPDEVPPDEVPSEDDTLVAGPDGMFDLDTWELRLKAGKYDGYLVEMAQKLSRRAVGENTRRWRIQWRDEEWTEDDYTLQAARHAEKFSGLPWGVLNLSMGTDAQMNALVCEALLYGLGRDHYGMDDPEARQAVKMPAARMLEVLSYFDADEPGKDDGSPT